MPELVTPELTLVRVADKEALNEYATARTAAGASVDKHLKANLSQLLGFDQVGNDRKKRWEATDGTRGTFYNLADVSWFYHADIREAIPLFGTAAAKHRQLQHQHGITDGVDVFKRVVEGKRSSREGWFCGQPPPALATLPDGASIIGLAAARNHGAAGTVLPDAPPVAITAPAATAAVTDDAVMLEHSERQRQETESLREEIARQHEHSERQRQETESLREEIAWQHEHSECQRRETESLREEIAPSADQQRRSYKLLDGEKVHVTVESLIQEADLEFDRDGMHDRILGDLSHLKIMRHNFSNVVT